MELNEIRKITVELNKEEKMALVNARNFIGNLLEIMHDNRCQYVEYSDYDFKENISYKEIDDTYIVLNDLLKIDEIY